MVGGAIAGAIPGIMKARWGANELVSSLMLNYVFYRLGLYLINYHYRDSSAGAMVSYRLPETSWLQQFWPPTRVHWGLWVALAAILFSYLFLYRTRWGYALRMTGLNKDFAAYAGISVSAVIIYSQVISGAIAGLAGAADVLGLYRRFQWQQCLGTALMALSSPFGPQPSPGGSHCRAVLGLRALRGQHYVTHVRCVCGNGGDYPRNHDPARYCPGFLGQMAASFGCKGGEKTWAQRLKESSPLVSATPCCA